MSDILTHIKARRSIRKFTDQPIEEGAITALLEAAMAAPSASNRQPWEFVVVTDADLLGRLRARLVLGRYRAPLAVCVCGNLHRTWPGSAQSFWVQDCSAAAQNILLASTGLGLGSVWVGVHPVRLFVRGVADVLNLPAHLVPLALIWVGHPAEGKPPRTQYDRRRVHWQRYGSAQEKLEDPDQGLSSAGGGL